MSDLRDDENQALAAFRDAARAEPASPFATARAWRSLENAIDAEARARAPWTPLRVGLVALVAGFTGAAAVVVVMHGTQPAVVARAPVEVRVSPSPSPAQVAVAPAPAPAPSPSPSPAAPAPAVEAPREVIALAPLPKPVKPVPRALSWRKESEALIDAGDGVGAARVIVRALATDDSAAAALALVAGRFPEALDAVDADLAVIKSPEAMRMRCEQKLLHKRDEDAVQACRAFGLEHPEHPGARTLAFAAGRVAEDIGDLALAEEAYARALLLSPFVGVTGTDALLARARVREARGDVDNARADLRLYLHNEPDGKTDPAVAALADRLGL